MARSRTIYTQAVNIRLHDHENADYEALIKAIFRYKMRVNYRANDYLMISHLRDDFADDVVVRGTFARFVEIDRESDWLDIDTGEAADSELLSQISIPQSLYPNYSAFHFRFNTATHLLVFEAHGSQGDLSPRSVELFFKNVLARGEITSRFGGAEVTIVADHTEVETLFEFDKLSKIKIVIERPNSDIDADEMERKVLEQLEAENARKLEQETTAISGQSLTPREQTVLLARVAAKNGFVETNGKLGSTNEKKSTRDIPLREGETYDPKNLNEQQAFDRAANKVEQRYKE